MQNPILAEILGLLSVSQATVEQKNSFCAIRIERDVSRLQCSCCDKHFFSRRKLLVLSLFDTKAFPVFDEHQVNCPDCGYKVENLSFASPWARMTNRFADYVARLNLNKPYGFHDDENFILKINSRSGRNIDPTYNFPAVIFYR